MAQLLPLNVGPSPLPASMVPDTESISLKRAIAWLKKSCSLALSVGKKLPAPAPPVRGPGSRACACVNGTAKGANTNTDTQSTVRTEWCAVFPAGGSDVLERSMAPPFSRCVEDFGPDGVT